MPLTVRLLSLWLELRRSKQLEIQKIKAVTSNLQVGTKDDKEFERRLKIADLKLKQKDLRVKEQSVMLQNQRAAPPPPPAPEQQEQAEPMPMMPQEQQPPL
jgi:hypothetical protein